MSQRKYFGLYYSQKETETINANQIDDSIYHHKQSSDSCEQSINQINQMNLSSKGHLVFLDNNLEEEKKVSTSAHKRSKSV